MPVYEYAPVSGVCDECSGRFEVIQRISDEKLTHCPRCGQECRRLVSAPAINTRPDSAVLSADNIAKHGFTQYKRERDGTYKKTAGKGPDTIVK